MIKVLSAVWALLLGIVLIMLGNGMHFTLIGLRGGIEGFSSADLAIVTSAISWDSCRVRVLPP